MPSLQASGYLHAHTQGPRGHFGHNNLLAFKPSVLHVGNIQLEWTNYCHEVDINQFCEISSSL